MGLVKKRLDVKNGRTIELEITNDDGTTARIKLKGDTAPALLKSARTELGKLSTKRSPKALTTKKTTKAQAEGEPKRKSVSDQKKPTKRKGTTRKRK
jgi:hypothetical protein